jgi:excisionase family DNA binding protein
MMDQQLLTVADAARRLGVTPAAVVAMERAGKLTALRTEGGMRLFVLKDVERLVAQRAMAGQERAVQETNSEVAS